MTCLTHNLPSLNTQLISINRLGDRLQHWSFKMNFEANIMDIKPSIVAATAACEEIKKSQSFKKLLEFILLTGNILNSGHEKVRIDLAIDRTELFNFNRLSNALNLSFPT